MKHSLWSWWKWLCVVLWKLILEVNDGVLRENETTHQTPLEKNNVFIPFMCLPFPVHTVPAKLVEDGKWNERMVCVVERGSCCCF